MILEQLYLEQLAQASYFIGDEESGTAAVVDPRRDVDLYVDTARERGLTIRHVLLTHFHADFVSGHLELVERTGATIHLGAKGNAEYDFHPVSDGDTIEFGRVRLEVLETPGHTPESISILVYDLAASTTKPHAVLTGDTLFNGDVGRPDLMASVGMTAEELASMMYDSLRNKLLPLDDDVIVYPGHGAGSACGKNMSAETWTTIGAQRAGNYALQDMSKEAFVAALTEGQSRAPQYFAHDAALNRSLRVTLDANIAKTAKPLGLDEVLRLQAAGTTVLDVRDSDAFAAGHLAGSLNIPLSGKFCSWAGTVLDPAAPFVVIADPNRHEEALVRLGRVGFDNVSGYLEGGSGALGSRPDAVQSSDLLTADEFEAAMDGTTTVLDVRTPAEWDAGHLAGAKHVPLAELSDRMDEVPRDERVLVHCQSGYRSAIAASLLRSAGHGDVADLAGGFLAWQAADKPIAGA